MLKGNDNLRVVLERIKETKENRIKYLIITHFELETLPVEIFNLIHLEELSIYNNKIRHLPPEIGKLKNLKKLIIGRNLISLIPSEIGELKNLQRFFAYSNRLNSLPKEFNNLKKLTHLDLSNNIFTEIPIELRNLSKLEGLNLKGNPLVAPPPEIIDQGIKSIQNYLSSIVKARETVHCNEAKLLIVGEGEVGKTCLMKKLINPDSEINLKEIRTEGIDINKWEISTNENDNFQINFWDFGGQEILHATHQFFLTKRSLYLLIWDSRRDENLKAFDYWLNIIKLLSDNSPVIIALNKIDINLPKSVDEESLQKKFNIVSFHKVSALNGIGIDHLIEDVKNHITRLPHIGTDLPKTWSDIRIRLERINENYIAYDRYLEICDEYSLDKIQADFLRDYYHDLGVFLNFSDNDVLSKIIFLRPDWATNAVYSLVENRDVQNNKGVIAIHDLKEKYWKNKYNEEEASFLIELMKRFELCFEIPNLNYIIPELLPDKKPKFSWIYKNNLTFEYHYEFMPSGIITRFISRNHFLLNDNTYWKNGLMLKVGGTEALIICEHLFRKIKIWVKGDDKKELLEFVRNDIDYIHKTLNHPIHKGMVPCVCDDCKFNMEPYLWDFNFLKKAKDRRKDLICENSLLDVSIEQVLNNTETTIERIKKFINVNKGDISELAGRFASGYTS